MSIKQPDNELDIDDPGDKTQNRFRFQAAFAAFLALQLVNKETFFKEIFCEQFEDILVKRTDEKYVGVQVKTRERSLGPFRFGDDEIIHTLKRFIKLELRYPDVFSGYIISANCGFSSAQNSSSLSACLEALKNHNGKDTCFKEIDFSKKVKQLSRKANCSEKVVFSMLNKVKLTVWADLDNYETILQNNISEIMSEQNYSVPILKKMVAGLIALTSHAATFSGPTNNEYPSYYAILDNPQQAIADEVLENKKITKAIVQNCFNECQTSAILLKSISGRKIPISPVATKVLEIKLSAGGVEPEHIKTLKDLNWSSQILFIEWLHRRGPVEAEHHADNMYTLVKTECQIIELNTRKSDRLYGEEMLREVTVKLQSIYEQIKNQYPEITNPHLLGIAAIVTEECELWWSKRFTITQETQNATSK